MNLEEILKQVDEWRQIGYVANSTEWASQIIRTLVERVQEAEGIIHDTLGWADSNPLAIKFGKAYLEKWGSK